MAANETAALVVALSAQVSKFQKDMDQANDIANKSVKKIEDRFAAANGVIGNKLKDIASSASGQLGTAGALLGALGPIGVAAAVGIGTAVAAIFALANATDEFATKAKALKEGAETAGVTITQFKLLGQQGKQVGLDFDETTAFFTKYIKNIEALRGGSGPLFDALLKIDTGLLRQLSAAKDSATAIDILVKAYGRLTDQSKKLDLAAAAGGRGGLSGGRLLGSLGASGISVAGTGVDEQLEATTERAAKLKDEIAAIKRQTDNVWGRMFAADIQDAQKTSAEQWLRIAQAVERIAAAVPNLSKGIASFFGTDILTQLSTLLPGGSAAGSVRRGAAAAGESASFDQRFGNLPAAQQLPFFGPPEASKDKAPAATELAIFQKTIAVLGDAVTEGEQWRLKTLQIAAAQEKDGVSSGIAQRALDAYRVTMQAAALAARERLGIATEEEIRDTRLAQLQQDRIKLNLNENQVAQATVIILREAKDAADALTVRQAYLPGLKQLELDAQNLRKTLDTVSVNSLNTLGDGLTDIVTGTKKASDAFRDMATSIVRDLVRVSIQKAIVGPLAAGIGGQFGGLFGGGGGGAGVGGAVGGIGANAGGTDNWRGGLTWVGEQGPELLNLPRGSQIIPNGASRGGGGIVNNVQVIAPPGATVTQQERSNGTGGMDLNVMIDMAVARNAATPGSKTNGVLRNQFGANAGLTNRG